MLITTVILLTIIALQFYNRYRKRAVNVGFLSGTWRNDYRGNPGGSGHENLEITSDGKYLENGILKYEIEDFKFSPSKNQITFTKSPVKPDLRGKLHDTLRITNNDLLEGVEKEVSGDGRYEIRYKRISNVHQEPIMQRRSKFWDEHRY